MCNHVNRACKRASKCASNDTINQQIENDKSIRQNVQSNKTIPTILVIVFR